MALTYDQYEKNKALLADPSNQFSPEARAKAEAAVAEADSRFMAAAAPDVTIPLTMGGAASPRPAPQSPEDAQFQAIIDKLDPMHPIAPQVNAIAPATTHPKGDEAAKDEWIRGDISSDNLVVVYDTPVAEVRRQLFENPGLYKALGFTAPLSAEAVAGIREGDVTHQAFNDHKWPETADELVKAGKTPYRYSRAPWMSTGKGAELLGTLSTKAVSALEPAANAATSFVMGLDKSGALGAGRASVEAANPELNSPRFQKFGREVEGGIPQGLDARTHLRMVQEEHPYMYGLGQGVAALAPWGVYNKVAGATVRGVGALAAKAGLTGALGQAAARTAGAAVGGSAIQTGHEAVDAASSYAQTGTAGTTLGEAGERVKNAGYLGGALGAAGELATGAARGVGKWVREGEYFEGLPGDIERQGVTPKFLRGYQDPPTVQAAKVEGRVRGIEPIDTFAEKLDEPLTAGAKAHTESVTTRVGDKTHEVAATPEGRALIPSRNTVDAAHKQFRERTSSVRGRAPTAAGIPNAERTAKNVFNQNIEGVSLTPREGWVPVPVLEAESLLNPGWQRRAVKASSERGGRTMHARGRADLARTDELGADVASRRKPPETGIERSSSETGAIDRRGYRANRPEQLPSGEPPPERGLARVDRYQEPRPRQLEHGERVQPPEHPELGTSDTRYERGVDWRWGAPDYERGGPMVQGSRNARPGESVGRPPPRTREVGPHGQRRPGPGAPGIAADPRHIPDAEFVEGGVRARQGAAAPRAATARRAPGKGKPERAPGTFAEEMRRRGVKTVYVAPRQYDLIRQESVIKRLRTPGADNAKNRDMKKLAIGALKDRDVRTYQGEAGGWSRLQRGHEKEIRAAKDAQKRAAPAEGGAYDKVIKLSEKRPGQSRDQRAIEDTAARAGGNALELLRGSRVMPPLNKLRARSSFGKDSHGQRRGWFGVPIPQMGDMAMMRGIYPATRALEPLTGAHAGQAARLLRIHEDNKALHAAQRKEDEKRMPAYEKKLAESKKKKRPAGKGAKKRRRFKL